MDEQEIENVEEVDGIFQQADEKNSGRIYPKTEVAEDAEAKPKKKMGIMGMLAALSGALTSGDITSHQARDLRSNMGISQSHFTRKGPSKAKIKRKRKLQKMARKAQRGK